MLTLPIKKEWYDLIKAGVKKEEYRDISPYYKSRFRKLFKGNLSGKYIAFVLLRNGYNRKNPTMRITCTCKIGKGREEWGAEKDKEYYVLDIFSAHELSEWEEE